MGKGNLGTQVTGPTVELAAKVKKALEDAGTDVETSFGTFYVAKVVLAYGDAGEYETVGYLVPDEAEGKTFDFWTPEDFKVH